MSPDVSSSNALEKGGQQSSTGGAGIFGFLKRRSSEDKHAANKLSAGGT